MKTFDGWYALDENKVPYQLPEGAYPPRDDDRRVGKTMIGKVMVSTVFLALNHSFSEEGPPILFETMVFGGPLDQEQERYATWTEAEAGHARWVRQAEAAAAAEFTGLVDDVSDGGPISNDPVE